ncbi:MAG: DUF4199 family protein [Crocinitomicaceae bacterium]
MKITIKIGILFAALWMIAKMSFFYTGAFAYNVVPSVMINILCLLLAITAGLYKQKREDTDNGNALRDIKNAMSAGVPYAVLVSLFIFFYYSKIDPGFNEHQIAEAEVGIQKMLENPESFAEVKKSNAAFEVMTKEDIYAKLIQGPRGFYNPISTMTVSMLAMLLLTTINSIFITIVYRKIVFR